MMREEFERLTGFYPSADLYRVVEVRYSEFHGDKTAFCKAYKANKDGLAESIQRDRDMAEGSAVEAAVAEIRRQKDAEITRLSRALEAERAKPTADDDAPMIASVLDETRDRLLAVHAMLSIIRNNVSESQTANAIRGLLFNLEDIAEGLETVIPCASGGLADRQRA